MDYFRHMHAKLCGGRLLGDVVEWDRNIGDTARILRNEKGEAAGFVVQSEPCRRPPISEPCRFCTGTCNVR